MNFKSTMMNTFFAVTVATTLAIPMTAAAKLKTTEAAVSVNFSDLDLSSTEGQEVLEGRLKQAAKSVCGSTNVKIAGSLANARANRACFKAALADAKASVENRYATAMVEVSAR